MAWNPIGSILDERDYERSTTWTINDLYDQRPGPFKRIQDREFQMIVSMSKTQIMNYAKYVLTGRLTGQIRIKKDPFRTTISFIFRIISACIILMQCFGRFNNKLSNLVASKLHYVKSRLRFPVWFATLHFLLNNFYCQKNKKDADTIYLI